MADPQTQNGQPRKGWRAQLSEDWRVYGRLLTFTRPYAVRLTVGAVFCAIFAASTGGILLAVRKIFERVFNPMEHSLAAVMGASLLLALFGLLRGVGDFVGRYYIEWVGNRVVMDVRNRSFERLLGLSVGYFTQSRTGELISRLSNDAALIQHVVAQVLIDLFKQPVMLISAVAILFWMDPRLTAYTLVLFPLCLVPIMVFGRRVRRASRQGQEHLADLLSVAQEAISGARIVQAFGGEDYERGRFAKESLSVFRRLMQLVRAKVVIEPIIIELAIVGVSLVLVYAYHTRMPIQDFFTFAFAFVIMYDPVKKLGNVHVEIQRSSAAAERLFEIMDAPPVVADRPGAQPLAGPIREVRLDHVGFSYEPGRPILQDIDLTVPTGQCLAIVGSSGSGKSTLVGLLPRFYDPTEGSIRINGTDLRQLTLASLRAGIGLVTQETFLFNDTVLANIAYGQRRPDRAAVEDAARRAHAHEFIMAMPKGYDTMIGERGVLISGGQRQRLAIARAILRNPPLLLLDEATSALDTESERAVQAALDELMAHRTVFVIAHRLSTIMRADRIIVLDRGRIVESGTHAELMNLNGVYRRLYELQFRE